MSSSTGSGGVGGECAWWSAEAVVEADRGGECEEAAGDAGAEAGPAAGAGAFEGEHVFERVENRFDPLPDRCQVAAAAGLVLAARPHDRRAQSGGGVGEFATGIAFVAEYGQRPAAFDAREQLQADLALACFGRGQF